MTEVEAKEIVATVNAYFNGVLLPQTVTMWANDLSPYDFYDAKRATSEYARAERGYPNIARFVAAICAVRDRRRMQPSNAKRVEATSSVSASEADRRTAIARGVAMDAYEKKVPLESQEAEFQLRIEMTDSEIAARRKWLKPRGKAVGDER